MSANWKNHPLILAAFFVIAGSGAMGVAEIPTFSSNLSYDHAVISSTDDQVADDGFDQTSQNASADPIRVASSKLDAELECMAKVVHHEAGNQPRLGQLAVAQTIMNRIRSGRFADTVCGVANQPRQFFRTSSYNPRRDTDRWAMAVEVSREAIEGAAKPVIPGAIYFHAAYRSPSAFFRTRERLAMLGDHVFYR